MATTKTKAAKKSTTKAKGTAKLKTKAGGDATPKKPSCLDAAAQVLKDAKEPMQVRAMVAAMKDKGLWSSDAPTPHATLYSAIIREVTKRGNDARFRKAGRGLFAYAGR